MNVNCNRCGVVNLVASEACKVCGADLQPARTYRTPAPQPKFEYQPPRRHAHDLIQPFSGAGELIGSTLSLCKNNFWLITKIVFVIMAPFEVFRVLSQHRINEDPQLAIGLFALQIFSNVLVAPALFYALVKVMETGIAPGINEAYRWGFTRIPKLALAAFVSWVLTALGLMLCVIPGIFVTLLLYVVFPVAVFEKVSAFDSLRRSYELTEGRRWTILAASLVLWIVLMMIAIPGAFLGFFLALNGINFWPLEAAGAVLVDILTEAATIMTLVVYLSILRALESGR